MNSPSSVTADLQSYSFPERPSKNESPDQLSGANEEYTDSRAKDHDQDVAPSKLPRQYVYGGRYDDDAEYASKLSQLGRNSQYPDYVAEDAQQQAVELNNTLNYQAAMSGCDIRSMGYHPLQLQAHGYHPVMSQAAYWPASTMPVVRYHGYSSEGASRMMGSLGYYGPGYSQAAAQMMFRSMSSNSANSSSTYSENYPAVAGNASTEFENNSVTVCNPAYISQEQSSPQFTAARNNDDEFYGRNFSNPIDTYSTDEKPDTLLNRSRSTNDKRRAARSESSDTDAGHSESRAKKSSRVSKRVASNIFHPTPQSMLAPEAAEARRQMKNGLHFPGTTTPGLPTEEEFSKMPTKRSRGRRPVSRPELLMPEGDGDSNPTEAQIQFVGTTKTGKPKKIFLCKVPGCGKCFKRSEHLKRHVRSIHTDEKPFQCQWPKCNKLFSRHDNLNQHLRIHREPGLSDDQFSAQLEKCFSKQMVYSTSAQSEEEE